MELKFTAVGYYKSNRKGIIRVLGQLKNHLNSKYASIEVTAENVLKYPLFKEVIIRV